MTQFLKSHRCFDCKDCNNKSPITKSLSDKHLEVLNKDRFEVVFKPDEMIYKQGTSATHIIFLTSGLAKVYIEGFQNKNLIIKILKEGEYAGGPGIFSDTRHHYSISALKETTACFIPVENWKTLIEENKDFNMDFIRSLNRQSIFTFDKMMSLTQKQMHGRMADALLYLSKEVYGKPLFELVLSRQDIADMTAMSKDSAIRVLKEFQSEGIITEQAKAIEITNMQKLENISQFG
ncbi:MAG: Crp/Fnr family transcriptional regulator [Bacteroidales bacterium]|nr:Crp/Fnr family transcriptional regulator [Bacteroidales bacterium]